MPKKYAVAAAIAAALVVPQVGQAATGGDSIWINPQAGQAAPALHYGDTFTAGYASKTSQAWGYAACRANGSTILGTPNQGTYTPGGVIWSEYRSLYAGGPEPAPFQLTDPIQGLWLGGGATCTVSLVKFSSGYKTSTVLATTTFTVSG